MLKHLEAKPGDSVRLQLISKGQPLLQVSLISAAHNQQGDSGAAPPPTSASAPVDSSGSTAFPKFEVPNILAVHQIMLLTPVKSCMVVS